jgi:hypothetical protein
MELLQVIADQLIEALAQGVLPSSRLGDQPFIDG